MGHGMTLSTWRSRIWSCMLLNGDRFGEECFIMMANPCHDEDLSWGVSSGREKQGSGETS